MRVFFCFFALLLVASCTSAFLPRPIITKKFADNHLMTQEELIKMLHDRRNVPGHKNDIIYEIPGPVEKIPLNSVKEKIGQVIVDGLADQ